MITLFFGTFSQFDVQNGFLSVVVITCASHAQGHQFEPGRKHNLFFKHTALFSQMDIDPVQLPILKLVPLMLNSLN